MKRLTSMTPPDLPPPLFLVKINSLLLAVAWLLASACADDYDDSALWEKLDDHEARLSALEEWQEQANQGIAALSELLNTTDLITAVTTLTERGDTVGYTISFRHADPITIYNGAKGDAGADGQTPLIGLTQAADGNWYWTLNGETMTDAQGNPIRANGLDGQDGQDGADGQDGQDGSDGSDGDTGPQGPEGPAGISAPTPQILLGGNITNGTIKTDGGTPIADAWYLSVDNGATWYRVSGQDGTGGAQGDSWFAAAPKREGNYYLFTLADQSTFRVAAYQAFRILADGEDLNNFDNATLNIDGATTLYLDIDSDIDYTRIVAQISSVDAVLTRAGVSDWKVEVGSEPNTLTVTPGSQPYALLDVSLLLTDGGKLAASRLLYYDPGYTDDGQGNYTVTSADGLKNITKLVNGGKTDINITLSGDINLTDMEWTPIGTDYVNPYTGTFDGGGHTITGLIVNQPGTDYVGLFGYIGEGGTVKDVTLTDVQITGGGAWGSVGGVAGWNDGTIENCSVSGSVSNTEINVGGVAGVNYGTVTDCSISGEVSGNFNTGGVIGQNSGILTACHATGRVSGSSNVGGVVGYNTFSGNAVGAITGCYSQAMVTGPDRVGGVVGSNNNKCTVIACYHATGSVSGTSEVGGVAGSNTGILTACYWGDNGQTQGIGYGSSTSTGETTQVTGDWAEAVNKMNEALWDSEWIYVKIGNLPILGKK